jgi:hypothetical protein
MGRVSLRSLRLILPLTVALTVIAVQGHAQNAVTSKFDHDVTGFPLTGTHRSVPCASCHINARFKTTPRACFGCHNGMTAPGAASVFSHPKTTNYCEGCHQTTTWRDYRFIDHAQALGPCANCHNNKTAEGKGRNHLITEAPCNTCHSNTVTWNGATVPATTTTTPAATGTTSATTAAPTGTATTQGAAKTTTTVVAQPDTSSSKSTSAQASSRGWSTSTKPNHAGFLSGCATCHNGVSATGKRPNHIATNAPCETCHKSTVTFAGARVDHASLHGTCISCHNGATAEGKPPRHLLTTAPCDACHRTTFWTPVTYHHTSLAYVNHGPGLSCDSCHIGNGATVAWKFPAFRMSCAGCHFDKYRPMAHVKFERPVKIYYTVSELRDCSGSCHTYADNTQRTIVTRNLSVHRALGGGW